MPCWTAAAWRFSFAGEQFTDEELKRLGSLHTLRGLIVDSTSVTQDGIAQLKQQLPELTVRVSSGLAVHRIRGVADVGWRRVDEESDVELPRNSAPSKYVGDEGDTLAGPEWLRELTPDFYFRDVESIEFRRRATRSHVENIRWLPHLRHVVLDECTLDDELLQLVASRAGVRQLDVRGGFNGELTTAGLRHLCKLPLRELRLGSLDLTNCDLSTLKSLRELHTLILDESHLTGEQLSELQQLDQLYSLRLIDARIPSGEWSRLENLPVEVLDLTGIWMAHEDFAFTHRMPNLQYLLLDNSGISDDQLAVIVKAKSLRGVGVSSTFITDTGVAAIAGMPELYEVDVSRTQVTEDGMKLLFRKDHRPLISADGIRMSPELSDQLGIGGGG